MYSDVRAPILFPKILLQALQPSDAQVLRQQQVLSVGVDSVVLPELQHERQLHAELPVQALEGLVRHLEVLGFREPRGLAPEREDLPNRGRLAVGRPHVLPERLFGLRDDRRDQRAERRRRVDQPGNGGVGRHG